MAITTSNQTVSIGADVIVDTAVTNTAVENVTGGAGTWYTICAVTTDAQQQYLKLFDATSITAGTTEPNWILPCKANDTTVWTVPDGVTFSNGLCYFVSEEDGKSATTAPANFKIWIVVKRS